jgi:hypothetical protein
MSATVVRQQPTSKILVHAIYRLGQGCRIQRCREAFDQYAASTVNATDAYLQSVDR